MLQSVTGAVLVVTVFAPSAGHTNGAAPQDAALRAVRDITEPPSAADVKLSDVTLQAAAFRHGGPGLTPIEGEPVAGTEYVVEAHVDGEQVTATMKFEITDQDRTATAPLHIVRDTTKATFPRYLGVITVPAHPFRIVLAGRTVTGEPFRREHRKLFRPVVHAPARPRPEGLSPQEAEWIERSVDEAGPRLLDDIRALVSQAPDGPVVMPRMEVSNVRYAPLLSAHRRPIGLRITYDVQFSVRGQFNPAVWAEAEYADDFWSSETRMEVLDSSITPMPREAFAPYGPVTFSDIRTHPISAGANYTYEAGILYHFTADLVPDFIVHNLDRSKSCIYYQRYRHGAWSKKAFAELLDYEGPTTYSVLVAGRKGLIENFLSEGTFHRSFVAEGAPDCGPQATRRF